LVAADRGRRLDPAFQPRSHRTNQVAEDWWLAEDRRDAEPAQCGGGM